MRHRSFSLLKSRVIMPAVALAILLAGTAKAVAALPAQQPPPSKAKTEPKKEKKVWTDENIGELRGKSPVSVVGEGKASGSTNGESADADKVGAKSTGSIPEKDPQWYRAKLMPLRADIERTDAEIRRMKEFLAGGHTAEGRLEVNRFSVPLNPANRIEELEKHKREVQGKIDEIEDQARRNSIAPGDIR